MTSKLLHREHIDTGVQQGRHVRAAKIMWRKAVDLGLLLAPLEDVRDRLATKPLERDLATVPYRVEQWPRNISADIQPPPDMDSPALRQVDSPLLPPRALDQNGAALEIDIIDVQPHQLTSPQPTPVEHRQDRRIRMPFAVSSDAHASNSLPISSD